jgi:hypothetical protein
LFWFHVTSLLSPLNVPNGTQSIAHATRLPTRLLASEITWDSVRANACDTIIHPPPSTTAYGTNLLKVAIRVLIVIYPSICRPTYRRGL